MQKRPIPEFREDNRILYSCQLEDVVVATSKLDKNKLKPNFNFEKLSLMEEEHLLTKASVPYRDQDLNSSKDDIIKRRLNEQFSSNLLSTKKWREKWGMTKLSLKSKI